jgi:hypothetical protein
VDQVTSEEFRWQDAHYNRDSRYGRELLFLIANSGWIRGTAEVVDITRSDAVDTTIKIDVDLDQITHEAFHVGTPRIWLPLLVLPVRASEAAAGAQAAGEPPRRDHGAGTASAAASGAPAGHHGRRRRAPVRTGDADPFTTLTVTDATGDILALVPDVDVRHWVSAALAEIIVNMAVARWVARQGRPRPEATRNQRLLLSAAIYRLLRSGPADVEEPAAGAQRANPVAGAQRANPVAGQVTGPGAVPVGSRPAAHGARAPGGHRGSGPLSDAKTDLGALLDDYIHDYLVHERSHAGGEARSPSADGAAEADGSEPGTAGSAATDGPLGNVLAGRAVQVLDAFAQAVVVVVTVDRDRTPTVLTVRVPTRRLERNARLNLGRPRARLQIDLLMPSADADRQVQINLPDGVRFDESRAVGPHAEMAIEVNSPQPLEHLSAVMGQLLDPFPDELTLLVRPCLADLAAIKAEAALETLRQYLVGAADEPAAGLQEKTDSARRHLSQLRDGLDRLSASPAEQAAMTDLRELWSHGEWLQGPLRRRTSPDTLSPRAAVARAGMIEEVSRRATPRSASIKVDVDVADAEFFSIARLAGVMSVLLMAVVLAFFAFAAARHHERGGTPSAEVLAGALTLFSAIQAGRIQPPDRSTLRGLLSATGTWLIVASILPTVVLAVALAFNVSGWGPVKAAGYAIAAQLLLQCVLQLLKWRGLLWAAGGSRRPPRRRLSTTPTPDYSGYSVLQNEWWRSATADALKIGRAAHAYVIWEHAEPPSLSRLLAGARQASRPSPRSSGRAAAGSADGDAPLPPGRPANILALLHSGTVAQALTFVVFREEPAKEWMAGLEARPVELDPDRLAPLENAADVIELFISVPGDREPPALDRHPLARVLAAAAEQHLIVLDAQLPVPSPSAGYTERIWARARVGLRDGEIRRLPAFLLAVRQRVAGDESGSPGCPPCDVLVRSVAERPLRVIVSASRAGPAAEPRRVLASEMDVVAAATGRRVPLARAPAGNWRVLALCANARVGIENDILSELSRGRGPRQRLGLAGLTYAVLHGTAVILMLAHQPDRHGDPDPDLTDLRERRADVGLAVLVNQWQSAQQLGRAGDEPLLRVRIHAQDRPGTLLDVLNSLNAALRAALPSLPDQDVSVVWHAVTRVTVGHATRLTARLAVEPKDVACWTESKLHEIERETRRGAANEAAARRSVSPLDDALGAPEDTVISVNFVEAAADPGPAES